MKKIHCIPILLMAISLLGCDKSNPENPTEKQAPTKTNFQEANPTEQTRYGTLATDDANFVTLNNKKLSPPIQGNNSISFVKRYLASNSDIVIIQNNGGTACPATFQIVEISKDDVFTSPEFGTCSDLIEVSTHESAISISMQNNGSQDTQYTYQNKAIKEELIPHKEPPTQRNAPTASIETQGIPKNNTGKKIVMQCPEPINVSDCSYEGAGLTCTFENIATRPLSGSYYAWAFDESGIGYGSGFDIGIQNIQPGQKRRTWIGETKDKATYVICSMDPQDPLVSDRLKLVQTVKKPLLRFK